MSNDRNSNYFIISENFKKNIHHLQKESGLNQAQIAKLANLPPTTVSGLFVGSTINPKIYTLSAIARVFNKSIGQLLGEIPLHFSVSAIPILDWSNLDVVNKTVNYQTNQDTKFISTNTISDNRVYALNVDSKISSLYKDNTLIIIEETDVFYNLDFVIVSINNSEPTIKKILKEGNDIFLESVSHNIPTTAYIKSITHIFGVIKETRF